VASHEHSVILQDGIQRGTLQRCPHCQGHFIVSAAGDLFQAKQSALSDISHPRIFCLKCDRLTCGRQCCDPAIACVPFEAKLEASEGTKTRYDGEMEILRERGLLHLP